MRRAQEAERREAEARTSGAQLMAEEAKRWAAMSTGQGKANTGIATGGGQTTKAAVKAVVAMAEGWARAPCQAGLVLEVPKESQP